MHPWRTKPEWSLLKIRVSHLIFNNHIPCERCLLEKKNLIKSVAWKTVPTDDANDDGNDDNNDDDDVQKRECLVKCLSATD